MKLFHTWNNLPWTPRGLKVKNAIEITLEVTILFAMICEPKGWQ